MRDFYQDDTLRPFYDMPDIIKIITVLICESVAFLSTSNI